MALTQRDRETLTPAQQAQIQAYTDQWNSATTDAERAAANAGANAIRAQAGYSGGDNGISYRAPNTYERADAIWLSGGGSSNNYGNSGYGGSANSRYGGDSLAAQFQQQLIDSQNSYAQALAEQKAANEAAVQRAVNSLEGQKTDTNRAYSDYYRQAYIDKMNAQKHINQRLSAQGITGGAAESTLLGLSTSYADALRQAEQNRIGTIANIDQAISDAQLTGDITSAQAAADSAKEQTMNQQSMLQYLLNRYDTLSAQQTAHDRNNAENAQAWARQLALAMIQEQGVMPDDETLAAAGITRAQAAALLPQTATGSGSVYSDLAAAGATDYGTAYAMLLSNGYNSTNAQRLATYFAENYMPSQSAGTNASTGTGTTSRVLYNNGNLTSAQVQELQAALGVTADGYFGPASQAAANARYGTTSAADAWAAYKAANSLAPTTSLTSLDYSPDEGVFTWNGKRYSSVSALENDLNAYISQGIITPAMEAELKRKLSVYGFNS